MSDQERAEGRPDEGTVNFSIATELTSFQESEDGGTEKISKDKLEFTVSRATQSGFINERERLRQKARREILESLANEGVINIPPDARNIVSEAANQVVGHQIPLASQEKTQD